ncbi:hypothetical protein ACIBH1_17880 [Nonomuraea sp. NPDC050663]|uniref:hypothetical protein n=1 Tax=Nonomuraea sp. NPDC050663 TaxID=3364370 RepID=UPI0037BADFEF
MVQEVPEHLDPRVAAFVVAMRERFNRPRPSPGVHWDETVITRYLNGERHPPEEFLDCLPDGHELRPLHRQALQARDRDAYTILVVADRLKAAEGRLAALRQHIDLLHDDLVKRELEAFGNGDEAGVGEVRRQAERAEVAGAVCQAQVAELEAELAARKSRAAEVAAVRAASLGMGERLVEAEARAAEAEGRMRLLEARLRGADEDNARLRSELEVQRGFAVLDARCAPAGVEAGVKRSHCVPEAWEVGLTHESWEWVRRHNAASDTPRSLYDGLGAAS